MDVVTRRRFLVASGVTAAAALVGGATAVGWHELVERAGSDPLPLGTGVVVLVTLYGGNDGLNTVVPAADPAYRAARPQLAIPEPDVLPLGEGLGLNPGLTGAKKLWDAGRLAIVRGVSYPKPDRSHFRSMAIWQTASPQTAVSTGWIGRWLDATGGDPLRAVALDPVLPPALAGATTAGAALPLSGLRLPGGALGTGLRALGAPQDGEPAPQARAAAAFRDVVRTADLLGPALDGSGADDPSDGDEERTNGASAGGRGALAAQLDVVRRCIELGAPARVYSTSLGGFDTHANERGTQQRLLTELDGAVTGFLDDLGRGPRGKDVVVLVYSEFGRRVAANASDGTDHGTAGPVLVAGAAVRGGFYGEQPSLTDLDDGDLKPTTDFRDVYATMLAKVLSTDPARVLDGHDHQLPLL
jgi:uncharacterized protein (DUF1501 family)